MNTEYNSLPSYKLAELIKTCKHLLRVRPDYEEQLRLTIKLISSILIERQVMK